MSEENNPVEVTKPAEAETPKAEEPEPEKPKHRAFHANPFCGLG
jgi:hypothetical protein